MTSCHEGSDITECPCLSSPITLQLWKEFSVLAFQEELPQAFSSGCQSQGRGSHFLATKDERLLRQYLICWMLFWWSTQNCWFERVDQKWWLQLQRKLLLTPNRTGMIWGSSVHAASEDLSLCFPLGQDNVALHLRTEPTVQQVSMLYLSAQVQNGQFKYLIIITWSYVRLNTSNIFLMSAFLLLFFFFSLLSSFIHATNTS